MKVVKLTVDHDCRISNFLVAMNITFMHKWCEFFILEENNAEKFKSYCVSKGVPSSEINKIDFSEVELNIFDIPCEEDED